MKSVPEIKIAKTAGFCFGVKRAVELVNQQIALGKKVYITDGESIYYDEWGTVIDFDGECYSVAIADGRNSVPIIIKSSFLK